FVDHAGAPDQARALGDAGRGFARGRVRVSHGELRGGFAVAGCHPAAHAGLGVRRIRTRPATSRRERLSPGRAARRGERARRQQGGCGRRPGGRRWYRRWHGVRDGGRRIDYGRRPGRPTRNYDRGFEWIYGTAVRVARPGERWRYVNCVLAAVACLQPGRDRVARWV